MRLIPVLLLAACATGDAATAPNTPTLDTLPNGVVQVTNPGPTQWADTTGWRLVEEMVIAPEEGSLGELGQIAGLVADDAGNVFVLQQSPVTIKMYGPDGEWLRDIGREGSGPSEFQSGMLAVYGDTLIVQDPDNARMTLMRTDGSFVASHPSQCCFFWSTFPIFEGGLAAIIGPPPPSGSTQRSAGYYLTRMDGTVADTVIVSVGEPDEARTWTVTLKRGNKTSMMGMSIPLQSQDNFAFFQQPIEVGGNTAAYRLFVRELGGDTLRTFTAPASTVQITPAQRDSIFAAQTEQMDESWRTAFAEVAKASDIPTTWPAWSDVATDRTGHVWVGRPGAKGAVTTLDVFTRDGVLLGSVPAPHARILDGYWTRDRVYLRDESEDGLPVIRVYRIQRDGASH
jgi:hypothetical protein